VQIGGVRGLIDKEKQQHRTDNPEHFHLALPFLRDVRRRNA
jgi:hypothetical protein